MNGAGFNPASAGFNTDLACTNATSATPTVTSASYTFVSGDINSYVYVASGTNWQPGWYQITSISAGAVLNAAIGAVIISIGPTGVVTLNTTAGCTSNATASLTAGTYGVDYSQIDTAIATSSTATSSGAGSVILFAGSTQSMIGNFVHVISGTNFTAGWYEIISEVAGVSITTDRASTTGIGAIGVINIGGSGRLNGLEDAFKVMLPAASLVWVKNGTYTFSSGAGTANSNATGILPSFFIGYNAIRGDVCNGTNRPLWILGANVFTSAQDTILVNISGTSTAAGGFSMGVQGNVVNCKFLNTSNTAGRAALSIGVTSSVIGGEFISQNGTAANGSTGGPKFFGNYFHDSVGGYVNSNANSSCVVVANIFASCTSQAIQITGNSAHMIGNNTVYGREAQMGSGLGFGTANQAANTVFNNIFYGLVTGITVSTGSAGTNAGVNNDFFNNTTDVTNWNKDYSDIAINPNFVGASQLTGTTATSVGSIFTDTSANFSGVNDGIDFLHVVSGTGVTVGCYLITSHSSTSLTTNNALGTSTIGNIVYWVSNGHNFQVGTALNGLGFPNFTNATGAQTTSYPNIGAVIPQASAGGASMLVHPGMQGGCRG